MIFFIFVVLFSKNIKVEVEGDSPSNKNVVVKEELDRIDIDYTGNIENLPRIVFIYEECGNLKVFFDSGELTRIINEKKKPGILQTYRCPNVCEKCFMRAYFCNKHAEYSESVR